ncbi:MAG: TRAP transporter TatT component family protein [Bacteroidota bacterium]|nr:TRAP transporter TatT component family protein [Bacteroidota bacterium]
MKIKHYFIPILLFTFSGCFQQIAIKSLGGIMDNGFEVINEEQDLGIAEVSIASNLKLLEAILKNDPANEHYLLLASMGYSSYALGFVEDYSSERARIFYLRGKEYGMKILNRNTKFVSAKGLDEFISALESFSSEDVPIIFWTAVGWGSFISINLTDPNSIADIPKVEAMMKYVIEKDPNYFYGGGHFFLGTLYGSRPKLLGGNPDSAKKHFDDCIAINSGKFLMTYVYYARSYAVQTQNKNVFENCLTLVDTSSIDILPQARLSNAIAKKKATLLREKIDDLFLESENGEILEEN